MGLRKYGREYMQDEVALDEAEALNILINWRNRNEKDLTAVFLLASLDNSIRRMATKLGFNPPDRTE